MALFRNKLRQRMRRRYNNRRMYPDLIRSMIAGPTYMQRRYNRAIPAARAMRARGAARRRLQRNLTRNTLRGAFSRWRGALSSRRGARSRATRSRWSMFNYRKR